MENNFGKIDISFFYNDLLKYYPLGLHWESPAYLASEQFRKLKELTSQCLSDGYSNDYLSKVVFSDICQHLSKKGSKETIENNMFLQPSYGGMLNIHTVVGSNVKTYHAVHFYISLISRVFIVFGTTRITLEEANEKMVIPEVHTVSPTGIFKETFELVINEISNQLPNYRYLPFNIAMKKIPGFYNPGNHEDFGKIIEALFIPGFIEIPKLYGNKNYRVSEWLAK